MGLFKKKEKEEAPSKEQKTEEEKKHRECFEKVCPKITGITDIVKSLKACKTVRELDEAYMEGMKGAGIMVGYLAAAIDAQREMVDCYNEVEKSNDGSIRMSGILVVIGGMCSSMEPGKMSAQAYMNFYNRDVEPLYESLRKKLSLDEIVERNKIDKRIELQMANNEIERLKEKIAELEGELTKKDGKETGE